jgi:hypothetical protein
LKGLPICKWWSSAWLALYSTKKRFYIRKLVDRWTEHTEKQGHWRIVTELKMLTNKL